MIHSNESLKDILAKRLGRIDPNKIVVVGVGNRMRGDDVIGPILLDSLQEVLPHLIDAGATPEEYMSIIKRLNPEIIIFLDALELGFPPGTIHIVEMDAIFPNYENTHGLSLDVLLQYLSEETGADVFIIGIQYGQISHIPGLSPEMKESIKVCAELIQLVVACRARKKSL